MIRFLRAWWIRRQGERCLKQWRLAMERRNYPDARWWQWRLERLGKWWR